MADAGRNPDDRNGRQVDGIDLERDLDEALRPLAGDPDRDAARVLAALDPGRPGVDGRQPPRAPWRSDAFPLLVGAVAAAAGLLVGAWLGGADGDGTPGGGPRVVEVVEAADPVWIRALRGPSPRIQRDRVEYGTVGARFPADCFVSTEPFGSVELAVAPGSGDGGADPDAKDREPAVLRLGPSSRLTVFGRHDFGVQSGNLLVMLPGDHPETAVETAQGSVVADPGSWVWVEASPGTTWIRAARRAARFEPLAGDPVEVLEGWSLACRDGGDIARPERMAPLERAMVWQVPLATRTPMGEEQVRDFLAPLVPHCTDPDVERALRRLGASSAPVLAAVLADDPARLLPAVRGNAVDLLCDLADFDSTAGLFLVLGKLPPGDRPSIAGTIARVSGLGSGQPPSFWAEADEAARKAVAQAWRVRVLGF